MKLRRQNYYWIDGRGGRRLNSKKFQAMKTLISLLGLFMSLSLAEAVPHTWTLKSGETVSGDYFSSGTTALVIKVNGTNCILKISSLSSEDQSLVAMLKATRTTATETRVPGKGKVITLSLPEPIAVVPAKPSVATIPLIEAVKTNDLEKVRALLASAPEQIKTTDEKGLTALYWAAMKGSAEVVSELISHGAEVNAKSKGDRTPLHQAVRKGSLASVQLLLENKADVNAIDRAKVTPLIESTMRQTNIGIIKLLLKYKADVNAVDTFGASALWGAAQNGNGEMVKILMEAGADVNARSKLGGYTVLMAALDKCSIDTIELLLTKKPDLVVEDEEGNAALDRAQLAGRKDVVALLKKQGAVNASPRPMSEMERSLVDFYKTWDTKFRHGNMEEKRQAILSTMPTRADVEKVFLQKADDAWKLAEADREIGRAHV